MSFSSMLEILQAANKEKIVLIRLGAFYIATGRDAILLHSKLQLKVTCFKNNICKVGVPVDTLDKYLERLDKTKYSYVVYNYDKEKKELQLIREKEGKKNKITGENINCLLCKGPEAYKEDEYIQALNKMFEKRRNEQAGIK